MRFNYPFANRAFIGKALLRQWCLLWFSAGLVGFGVAAEGGDGEESASHNPEIEEVTVVARGGVVFSNAVSTHSMAQLQTPLTSVLAIADNLPGVSVQEGDTFGFDDWSTTLSMRGFKVNLDEQQLGTTIDGMPNGDSNYGGGAKANRYIDTQNLSGVLVTQGTADIGSRSNEALGGTLDFTTDDPREDRGISLLVTRASFEGEKHFLRFDTGRMASGMRAWISGSRQTATDWMEGSAENERAHLALKVQGSMRGADWTAYAAWDDTHEDNYQRLLSAGEFAQDSGWDRLAGHWTGVPHRDQAYRRAWSTLRENNFAYLKAGWDLDQFQIEAGAYYHHNQGRGDWPPPYLVDVVDDGGYAEREHLGGSTAIGGTPLRLVYFVDQQGVALFPTLGCVSSITFPYGGAGPEADPACHGKAARAVQSYRHTHYRKTRGGVTLDFEWHWLLMNGMESHLQGGLWIEQSDRKESRDWHEIKDTRVGPEFEPEPYWLQYARKYPAETRKWYVEETVTAGRLRLSLGAKGHRVDIRRRDILGETEDVSVNAAPGVLWSGGVTLETLPGVEAFAGYAKNLKALSDLLLERPASALQYIEPEQARNIELGVRYKSERASVTATWYDIEFKNRILFVDSRDVTGPDFLDGTEGAYVNAGGVDSEGFEMAGRIRVSQSSEVYLAYTHNSSRYLGAGSSIDAAIGRIAGNHVSGVPDEMLVASIDWRRGNFTLGASFKNTGSRYVDHANQWKLPGYATTDFYAEAHWDMTGAFTLRARLTVNNLFDEAYLAGTAGSGAWLGAARTLSLTLEAMLR